MSVTGLWAGPDAPRPLDAALTDRQPRPADWLAAQGPKERRALWGCLDSQLLLGERVLVHEVENGWARVTALQQPSIRDGAGYPGFVPAHHLRPAATAMAAATVTATSDRRVVVHQPVTAIRDAPSGNVAMSDVSFATVLPVTDRTGASVAVRLPGGVIGWLPGSHVEDVRPPHVLPTGEELVAAGQQFLGVRYLAGGVHGSSFDCSGLVHALFRRFGLTVPRDAGDQVSLGTEVAVDEASFGDLMFFTNPSTGDIYHVGICVGLPRMLHASQTDWAVIDTPVPQRRIGHLSHVRRLRSGCAPAPPGSPLGRQDPSSWNI